MNFESNGYQYLVPNGTFKILTYINIKKAETLFSISAFVSIKLSDYFALKSLAAPIITLATASGCDIKTQWLPLISVALVLERLYIAR